jgi:hypothetical protein
MKIDVGFCLELVSISRGDEGSARVDLGPATTFHVSLSPPPSKSNIDWDGGGFAE